ncbi:dihydrofolate reductase family protein [Rubrivirga sp.]|uniref:dihydrofolate reductase family protein n=1 Tax=Rubrivirga sp. TaxID=1885344 RepID=UPI003C710CD9
MNDHDLTYHVTYHVAATLDGFIAHDDGSFEGFSWDEAVVGDFLADLDAFGTVLMGRKTYDVGLKEGKTSPYPTMRQVVFSRTMAESPDSAVEIVREDPVEFVRDLMAAADAPVWLCGGGELAGQLAGAGLIDRVVVKLNPVVFGSGIPLFGVGAGQVMLDLEETKAYDCGVVVLRYVVRRKA